MGDVVAVAEEEVGAFVEEFVEVVEVMDVVEEAADVVDELGELAEDDDVSELEADAASTFDAAAVETVGVTVSAGVKAAPMTPGNSLAG